MKRASVLAILAALATLACARSPQQAPATMPQPSRAPAPAAPAPAAPAPTTPAPAVDPAGVYDFVAVVQGQEVRGTINVVAREGGYSGVITSSALPDMPITSVAVSGSRITLSAGTQNGDVTIEFTMAGEEFTGNWSMPGDGGPVTGRRRPG